ncbi:hypothetical protein I7I51_07742, partial [Histoplasma capsulatum]
PIWVASHVLPNPSGQTRDNVVVQANAMGTTMLPRPTCPRTSPPM